MEINLQEVIRAARAGGDVLKRYFGEALVAEQKTTASDLRTKADTESEQAIIAALSQAFPTVNIYAEESGRIDHGSGYTFVVDPLDGTSNFVLGVPDFAISIGLLRGNEAVLGVVYNPILEQLFTAEKGKGAFLNEAPIHVNNESDPTKVTVSYTCGYQTPREYSMGLAQKLYDLPVKRVLDHWSPAYDYCLLAAGRLEIAISKDGDLEDYVAAKVILAEAGAKVTNFAGHPVDGNAPEFVASNGTPIHEAVLKLLS